jgi:hypothetical protein
MADEDGQLWKYCSATIQLDFLKVFEGYPAISANESER